MPAAEALENRLKSRSYPVQIVKSRINGTLYFRVRVGPYASRAEAQTVLSRLREKEGFSAAYFCAP
jgi:cell division septation protein DedD